jgi:hypothetical protein
MGCSGWSFEDMVIAKTDRITAATCREIAADDMIPFRFLGRQYARSPRAFAFTTNAVSAPVMSGWKRSKDVTWIVSPRFLGIAKSGDQKQSANK